jgi:hypothetical protein
MEVLNPLQAFTQASQQAYQHAEMGKDMILAISWNRYL